MFRIIITAISLIILSQFGVDSTVLATCEGCPGETPMDVKIRNILGYLFFFGFIAISVFLFYRLWKKRSKR